MEKLRVGKLRVGKLGVRVRVGVGELVGGRILYEVKAGAAGKEKAAA